MNNFIPRRYNYTLETGVIGTDDEDIANILYNVNRMEMKASFFSEQREEMEESLSDVFFMIADSKVHLGRFMNAFEDKLDQETLSTVKTTLDEALKITRAAEASNVDLNAIHSAMLFAYKRLLSAVPFIHALDNQAVGKDLNA
ncbi:MAG: hypothetical protein ACI4TE_00590 [Alphaproteobacteria bacterium]